MRLRTYPYVEMFIVQEGHATYTIDSETIYAGRLLTKQLLCQLRYAGLIQRVSQAKTQLFGGSMAKVMSKVFIEMSMSLDGYVTGPNDGPERPLGDGGERLHEWMFGGDRSTPGGNLVGSDKKVFDELRDSAGAMISGRRLYDIVGGWGGSHPIGGIPVFVVSVTEGIASAVAQAKEAAGDRDVYVIGGASIDQQLLTAGLVDELRIDVIPILLGGGIRLFDNIRQAPIELEQVQSTSSTHATHVRYRVLR